ncbi:hypothetical protein DENSPDRAFT_670564 [Dentipellis sp. KUC8613]|nr:hypothetical protein DENSPDRAFT_670564 [Dentipellis sp. KUC8613]
MTAFVPLLPQTSLRTFEACASGLVPGNQYASWRTTHNCPGSCRHSVSEHPRTAASRPRGGRAHIQPSSASLTGGRQPDNSWDNDMHLRGHLVYKLRRRMMRTFLSNPFASPPFPAKTGSCGFFFLLNLSSSLSLVVYPWWSISSTFYRPAPFFNLSNHF